jgi:hypothetical protein
VRSDGSRDFANSLRRILTVRSSSFSRTSKVFFFQRYLTACNTNFDTFSMLQCTNFLCSSLTILKDLYFLGFFPTLSLKEDPYMHSLQQIPQLLQGIEVLRLCALPAVVVLQQFLRFANSGTLLGLRTPCMTPVPSCTSEGMRTKAILSELSETNL